MYISENCNWTPYGTDPKKDKLVDLIYWEYREEAAKQGYGLDKLVNDNDPYVRREVAKQGYGLDILVNDKDAHVREEVAKHGYGLDILINDEDWYVRQEVARHGYGLDILVSDKSWPIRQAVAKHGYGLDKLRYDTNNEVRDSVTEYLKNAGYKDILDWAYHNPNKLYNPDKISIIKTVQEVVHKIDNSNKIAVQTEGGSIDEFFNESSTTNDECGTLTICSIDTKSPIIKFKKTIVDNKVKVKFIVDLTNANGDDFIISSVITSPEHLTKLIQQTIDMLKSDLQLSKYADDLEECL